MAKNKAVLIGEDFLFAEVDFQIADRLFREDLNFALRDSVVRFLLDGQQKVDIVEMLCCQTGNGQRLQRVFAIWPSPLSFCDGSRHLYALFVTQRQSVRSRVRRDSRRYWSVGRYVS